jgi:hypothetical protein
MNPPRCEASRILLCDDIREEADGRQSLIGLHGPSLRLERLPYVHRGLSAFVQLVDPRVKYKGVEFELAAPDGAVIASGSGPTPGSENIEEKPLFSNYRIHFFPLTLTLPGPYTLRVWLDRAADEGVEAKLSVKVDPATQRPSQG